MTARRWTMAVGAVALLTTAGACGGDDGGGSADEDVASLGTSDTGSDGTTDGSVAEPTAEDREEAMLAFAECMREQGIDMPDPQIGANGETAVVAGGEDMDMEAFEAANEVCQPLMEDAMGEMTIDPEQQAEMQEQMLEYAQCMRDHGIDMEDPQFDEGGGGRVEIHHENGGDGDDADFQAAEAACAPEGSVGPAAPAGAGPSNDADGDDGGDSGPGVVIRTGGGEGEG